MSQVCFDRSAFYTVMIVGFCVMGYALYVLVSEGQSYKQAVSDRFNLLNETLNEQRNKAVEALNVQRAQVIGDARANIANQTEQDDFQRMINPMVAPARRWQIPGYGLGYEQTGYLYDPTVPEKAMPLMGRRVHSNQYEYYTFHPSNPTIKIPLTETREINDGDDVKVHGYEQPFKTKIYALDAPRYYP